MRLTPRRRGDRIDGVVTGADGTSALAVSVSPPPADGRANDALLRLLAKEWGLARRDLAIVAGPRSRNKVVRITGDPVALLQILSGVLARLPRR